MADICESAALYLLREPVGPGECSAPLGLELEQLGVAGVHELSELFDRHRGLRVIAPTATAYQVVHIVGILILRADGLGVDVVKGHLLHREGAAAVEAPS